MSERLAERFLGTPAPFAGMCRGGPYDGQRLAHDNLRYPMAMLCSTDPNATPSWFGGDWVARYQHATYEFVDSTWVWKP